jgi:hypothetical protein
MFFVIFYVSFCIETLALLKSTKFFIKDSYSDKEYSRRLFILFTRKNVQLHKMQARQLI